MLANSLIKRTITALILVPLVIIGIFTLPTYIFTSLVAFIVLFAAWEWTNLMPLQKKWQNVLFLVFLLACFLVVYLYLFNPSQILLAKTISWLAIAWWLLALIWILAYAKNQKKRFYNIPMFSLIGCLVLFPCWYSLSFIRSTHQPGIILYLLFLIWSADTGAYFAGRLWGKTKLIPAVSPGKTWTGLWGGIVSGLICALIAAYLFHFDFRHLVLWLLWSFLTILVSVVGDLFISVIKRQSNVKDSGTILPGHGGVLDRIDSLTAAAPFFVLGMIYFGF